MNERLDELNALLVRRATEGLEPDETRQLNGLMAEFPNVDPEWADRLVGELDAEASLGRESPVSAELRSALLAAAPREPDVVSLAAVRRDGGSRLAPPAWLGWAAAAVLGALWLGGPIPSDDAAPDFATVAASPDAVVLPWTVGGDPTGADASGEIVWSAASQQGVMRVRGLRPNVSGDFQYQLWIFDAERDARFPVDGGVFDVPDGMSEVEIPIQAKLGIATPTLFAVTVEPLGGVVVSDRERIAILAEA